MRFVILKENAAIYKLFFLTSILIYMANIETGVCKILMIDIYGHIKAIKWFSLGKLERQFFNNYLKPQYLVFHIKTAFD